MTAAEVEVETTPDVPTMRAEAAALLIQIEETVALLAALAEKGQRELGFSTFAGRAAMDDAIRAERRGHVRPLGVFGGVAGIVDQKIVLVTSATNTVHKVGQAPTPGNLKVLTTDVDAWKRLRQLASRTVHHLYRRGVCAVHPLPDDATVNVVVLHVARLLPLVDDAGALQAIAIELGAVLHAAGEVVYGESRVAFDEPCPHCQRRTLVAYFARPTNDITVDFIRCDVDPQTGHMNRCTCSDPLCECKRRPYSFRHTWYRKKGTGPDTWLGLNQRLGVTRTAKRGSRP